MFVNQTNLETLKPDSPDYKLFFRDREIGVLCRRIDGEIFRITFLGILPSFRGRGHKKEFLKRIEGIARREGCRYIETKGVDFEETNTLRKMGYTLYKQARNGIKTFIKRVR